MMKKYILIALALLLALSITGALGEETEPTEYTCGDYEYILLPDGTAEISRYIGQATERTVPSQLDGYNVTSIGDEAFLSCNSLASITIPESVTSMGINPFAGCWKLAQIKVSPDHPVFAIIDNVLFHKQEKKLICYPGGLTAESYTVPTGIRMIGDDAFYYCDSLASITLPKSITQIDSTAFTWCSDNLIITVPRGSYAADWCKKENLNYTYSDANDWLLN